MKRTKSDPTETLLIASTDQTSLRRQLLERILADPNLPSPPTLALQIVEKTRGEDSRIQDVCDLLVKDAGLCGNVLKTINSPLYGLHTPVGTLGRAVTFLGLRAMRSLVLSLSLPALARKFEIDQGLRNYWMGSVAGAIMSQELARRVNTPCPEDDLVASLLRDLGMLLLRQTFGESYRAVWNGGDLPFSKQCEWEDKYLGIHHADVGAALLTRWGLPADIVEPVRLHHCDRLPQGLSDAITRRTKMLSFTSRLAQLGLLPGNSEFYEELTRTADVEFGMNRIQLEAFLGSMNAKIEEFTALLDVDIGSCPNFAGILAAGCEELARLSIEMARPNLPDQVSRFDASDGVRGSLPEQKDGDSGLMATTNRLAGCQVQEFSQDFFERVERGDHGLGFIEHYEVKELLGQGAMGIVLKAHDHRLHRSVAVKVLAPELSECSTARKRFALEARFAVVAC
jgi:eukaryotic-like serine/threonine-protein kinase